jgi:hypothetical protein
MKTYWVPGMNHLGTHGRWPLAEFCDNDEIGRAKVESQFSKMITADVADTPSTLVKLKTSPKWTPRGQKNTATLTRLALRGSL